MRLPETPPDWWAAFARIDPQRHAEILLAKGDASRSNRYLHWDQLKRRSPPAGLSTEEWWFATKFSRLSGRRSLSLTSTTGQPLSFTIPDWMLRSLHQLDQSAGGRIEGPSEVLNASSRDQYLISSRIEEAITSSQLEGASTTHRIAKEMLRAGRRPRDKSERMIFNNHSAMRFVRERAGQPLTREMLLELHEVVARDTLETPSAAGRFRYADERVEVVDAYNTVLHVPPPADQLDDRVDALCRFANAGADDAEFIHPVIRSILLHFMVGYDHPFVDGNGRTARALYYWSMARHKYWMMEYVSVSSIIRKSPARYARAYLYTETDEFDATYFVDFNLRVVEQGIAQLHKYLARKASEIRDVEALLGLIDLNHRQVALITHLLKRSSTMYTIEGHRGSHNTSYETARTDLQRLEQLGVLASIKRGRAFVYRPVRNYESVLRKLAVE